METPRHILIVEDDPNDIELTLNTLEENNLVKETVVVRDGTEALDYLFYRGLFENRPKGNPELIMLDLKMPKLDGVQVLRQIKNDRELGLVPVVVLTSSKEERDLKECYALGVNAYVVKPVHFVEFADAIRQIGDFWILINEPPPRI